MMTDTAPADVVDATAEQLPAVQEPQAGDLMLARAPQAVLEDAQKAARALKDVIDKKPRRVTFNGETYLEFEDLQTLGRFYGVTAKTLSTTYVEFGAVRGFEARAAAVTPTGQEISAAEAMCLDDEKNWRNKPLFQLRSMAQTRACAKALRNVLSWVVVLAGYRATPAEEMEGVAVRDRQNAPPAALTITAKERQAIFVQGHAHGHDDQSIKDWLAAEFGVDRTADILKTDYPKVMDRMSDSTPLPIIESDAAE